MPIALIALALGGFGIGLTEFIISGLLPELSVEFSVSIPTAGYLVSGYALSVAIGAIGVTAAVIRLPRKQVLLGLMVLFIAGNLLSAIAPSFALMLAGRVIAALCHGAFFGIGSVVAAGLVAPAKRAAAIALMFTGLTVANVIGVPFGTMLGQSFGWRSTFWVIVAVGIVALAGIAVTVPKTAGAPAPGQPAPSLLAELKSLRSSQVWLTVAITILGYGGMFGAFTYLAPLATDVAGFDSGTVPWLQLIFGLGMVAGNLLGARAADRGLDRALLGALGGLTVVLLVFALLASSGPGFALALVLMAAFGFALVPPLQTRVVTYGGDAPTMASAANISAFNLGNAFGAWVGGLTIAAGLGYTSVIWDAATMTVLALLVALFAARRAAGGPGSGGPGSGGPDAAGGDAAGPDKVEAPRPSAPAPA